MKAFDIQFPGIKAKLPDDGLTFLALVKSSIIKNIQNPQFGVSALSKALGLSASQLTRKLKIVSTFSPGSIIKHIRMEHAVRILLETTIPIKSVALAIGFPDPANFCRSFKRHFHISPGELRNNTAKKTLIFNLQPNTLIHQEVQQIYVLADRYQWLNRLLISFHQNISEPSFKINQLANELSLTPAQLNRKFKALFKLSLGKFLKRLRLYYAAQLLKDTKEPVVYIACSMGFFDHAHFSKSFKSAYKHSPASYRKLKHRSENRMPLRAKSHLLHIDNKLFRIYNF